MHAVNPYMGENFLNFIAVFAMRMRLFFTGRLGAGELVSDEIQVFVLAGVAVSSSLLGCYLVLRKMTMLANAMSHTILLGIVAVYFFSAYVLQGAEGHRSLHISIHALLAASLLMGIVTTFLTEFLTKSAGLQEDASIGIVFTSLFALGVILVTLLTRNAHIGTEVIMGNADALRLQDLKLVLSVLVLNAALVIIFYKEYAITTFDSGLSRALGFSPAFFNYLLMTQVSATAIGGFRAVGVLMVLALMTGPPLTARLLTNHLKSMLLLSAVIGILSAFIGVALSRHFLSVSGLAFSTGGVVVCVIIACFLTALPIKRWIGSGS